MSSADTYVASSVAGSVGGVVGGVGSVGGGVGSVVGAGSEGDDWRRDTPKHAPYLEPVSPPDNQCSGLVSMI